MMVRTAYFETDDSGLGMKVLNPNLVYESWNYCGTSLVRASTNVSFVHLNTRMLYVQECKSGILDIVVY
jgi:hypothetical protein